MSYPTYTVDEQRLLCREARERISSKLKGKTASFLFFGCVFTEADTIKLTWGRISKVAPTDAYVTLRRDIGPVTVPCDRIVEHAWGEGQVSQLMRKHGVNDLKAAA
jgi:hypothetical protein